MKIRYLLMLSIIALMCSQCKMRKTFVEDSEIAWVECYSPGDTLLFKSGLDSVILVVDTIYVFNPNNDNPYDWEGTSIAYYFEVCSEINGFCMVKFKILDDIYYTSQFDNDWARITVSSHDKGNQFRFKVGELYLFNEMDISKESQISFSNDKQFTVRASDYKSSEEIEQKKKYHSEDPVTDFEWSRERGLISFTFNDTTVYRLEKHIHKTEVL